MGQLRRLRSADAAVLGQLTGLIVLRLFANDLQILLPHLSSLSNLEELTVNSLRGDLGRNIQQFSSLVCLQNLTALVWGSINELDKEVISLKTLSTICSLTRLHTLDLGCHEIRGPAAVKLLAALPCLKALTVDSLLPEEGILDIHCGWMNLTLRGLFLDLKTVMVLPHLNVKHLDLNSPWICLGPAHDSPEALSALAKDLRSATQILARVMTFCFGWKLEWEEIPLHPSGFVFAGLAPLAGTGLLTDLELINWSMDLDAALQVAKSVPSLKSLTLEGCRINHGALTALGALASLSELRLYETPISDGAAAEAVSLLKASEKQLSMWMLPHSIADPAALEAAGGQIVEGKLVIIL